SDEGVTRSWLYPLSTWASGSRWRGVLMFSSWIRVAFSLGAATSLLLSPTPVLAQPEEVVPPKLLQHVDAPYPASQGGDHIETSVVVFVTVDTDGSVRDAQVVESSGPDFDQSALETAKTWRFIPATRGGKPIRARIRLAFHFAPHPPAEPPPAPPPKEAPG